MTHYLNFVIIVGIIASCVASNPQKTQLTDKDVWELSYQMFSSSILEKNELGIKQFNSLLQSNTILEPKFLHIGLEFLLKQKGHQRALEVFNQTSA